MLFHFFKEVPGIKISSRDNTHLRPVIPQMPCQCPRIDPLNADHIIFLQIPGQAGLRTPVAREITRLLHDKSFCLYPAGRFYIFFIDPVIADLRIGHGHDLAFI